MTRCQTGYAPMKVWSWDAALLAAGRAVQAGHPLFRVNNNIFSRRKYENGLVHNLLVVGQFVVCV